MAADHSSTASTKFFGSLRTLMATLLTLVQARVELVSLEFQEEKIRYKQMLLSLAVAAVFFGVALVLVAVFVIVLFWDSYRLLAIAGTAILYGIGGGLALLRLNSRLHASSLAFSATLHEFERDQQLLRGQGND